MVVGANLHAVAAPSELWCLVSCRVTSYVSHFDSTEGLGLDQQ